MLAPLTVPETRRLLGMTGGTVAQQRHHQHWSHWRRAHQATAQRCHTARRARRSPSPAHGQAQVITVAGTPALTDALWVRLAPLLPPCQGGHGRRPSAHRPILAGLLWMMHTGVGWRELPARFGAWQTLYSRHRQWCRDGTWARIVAALPPTEA